jgi:hypothetical protein
MVALHEMTHGMGAVPKDAPHSCDNQHVCDNSNDLMKSSPFGPGDTLANTVLDSGRDDYYAHAGTWLDVRNSLLLYDLDQSLTPAPDIAGLTATNVETVVRVEWAPSGMYYRVYDENGKLTTDFQETTHFIVNGTVGQTLTWTVRAVVAGGILSRPATIHFKVGYGIVDASGALLKDTVRPEAVTHLRVTVSRAKAVLRWPKVADPIGLRGYRVTVSGQRPLLVTAATVSLTRARVRGKSVSVASVDRSGNAGDAATARIR